MRSPAFQYAEVAAADVLVTDHGMSDCDARERETPGPKVIRG